ncbi:MAG: hypothetical protein ACREVL_10085, partial [Solimonas sp.]
IDINAGRIMGQAGADVHLEAGVVNLTGNATGGQINLGAYDLALRDFGVQPVNADTHISIAADTLLQVSDAQFYGYSDTLLSSQGDIRLTGAAINSGIAPTGHIETGGKLTLKADQIYAATGRKFTITAGDTLEILPQDAGTPLNGSPYEVAAELTLTAPRIVQAGTLRSPQGTINLIAVNDGTAGAGTVTLKPGSLTSTSLEGRVVPYGYTINGDTWIDPFTGLELTTLPAKSVNLKGDTIDMQAGAVLDVSGGGNLYAREFVPGIGGSKDWLTGYRDANYQWVDAPGEIFAVIPGFEGDIAPIGVSGGSAAIGEKVYLSGGSGLPAGYYTLLPAEYALLPGAYRVTSKHNKGDYSDMPLGTRRPLADGSSIQAGYRYVPGSAQRDQRTTGFMVMPGMALRERSQYTESYANTFFLSDAFLKKALRTNRPIGDLPRIPLDGGSVVLEAGKTLNLDATLKSAAAEGGRGGFADIKSAKIAVVGTNTDLAQYQDDGYLILDSERLNTFGAESLLLGGVRRQGAVNMELDVAGTDIVVDNAGSTLSGPELLFASTGRIDVKDGSKIETSGQISGSSGDLRIRPQYATRVTYDPNTPWDPSDDILVHGVLDQGTVLRLSSGEQVDILRDIAAVDAMATLRDNPAVLAAVNAQRATLGLAPIVPGGTLNIADGASLSSSRSLALDATTDTLLGAGASLSARQISAAASRVSIGAVPAGTAGLVFGGGSLGALANASDLTLKSYSSIDIYGGTTLQASDGLRLDTRQLRVLDADGQTVTIGGKSLALTNSNGGTATAVAGNARLVLQGDNVYFEGHDKWLSGVDTVTIKARERLIGRDDGTLYVPGDLAIEAGAVTADSGSRLFLDATGDVVIRNNGNTELAAYKTFGATLGITGRTLRNEGQIKLTGGTVSLRARDGALTLADGSLVDVTSDVSQIFDKKIGVGAGTINLIADNADIDMAETAVLDVSGIGGGDAGTLKVSAGLGHANLRGQLKGGAEPGARSGSFEMVSRDLADFAAFNTLLDSGGFHQRRRFEINEGDVTVSGNVQVQDFSVVANDGSIRVTGSVETTGDNGGRIQLSAAESVRLESGAKLLARAKAADGSGGTVFLETVGQDGGVIDVGAGSLIDVSGTGEGGRTVRLRAPQIGNDVGIAPVAGTITGARSVIAEGFRVYDGVHTIDQGVIDTVSNDAADFMVHADAIRARLGSGITVAPGIELRSDADMELTQDWDLHALRFNGSAGVLTLRAKGDLKINGNLSDGFDGTGDSAALLNGESWTLNLTGGANTSSPDSLAVLPQGQLAAGKGSVIIGGTADTIEYFTTADGSENKLYRLDSDGNFVRDPNESNYKIGWIELERDPATGQYIDPRTGALIAKDPASGDYVDTAYYARRPLPWFLFDRGGGYPYESQTGEQVGGVEYADYGYNRRLFQQWDNSTGYVVRTGTAAINVAAGRDLVLKERPSVIYTAGERAADIAGFYA